MGRIIALAALFLVVIGMSVFDTYNLIKHIPLDHIPYLPQTALLALIIWGVYADKTSQRNG